MIKRLSNFTLENQRPRSKIKVQVLEMQFGDDEATKRVVMHNAKRVIQQHKEEIQELAYK